MLRTLGYFYHDDFVGLIGVRSVFHTTWNSHETVPAYPWMLALAGDFSDGGMWQKIDWPNRR